MLNAESDNIGGLSSVHITFFDVVDAADEDSDAIIDILDQSFHEPDLNVNDAVTYSAGSAPVNYATRNSLLTRLKAKNTALISNKCKLHIIHNGVLCTNLR